MSVFNSQAGQMMFSQNVSGLLLCVGGNASMLVSGSNYQISRGTLCIISPFLSIEMVSSSDDCKWEMICDEKDIFHSVAIHIFDAIAKNNIYKNPIIQLDEKEIEKFMFFVDMIKDKQRMLASSSKEDNAIHQQNIALLEQTAGIEFLSLYFSERPVASHKMSRNENVAYYFINMVNNKCSTQRNVGWYAEQVGLTSNYFSQIVHQYTGCTPTEWIKDITITKIKILLSQPELSIKEIAAQFNFSDQFAFRKYFKNCTGMSPREYRESLRVESLNVTSKIQ